MSREALEEPVDAWCECCGSRGKPPGDAYCEECRPLRAKFVAEMPSRDPGQRLRLAVHRLTGLDVGRNVLGAAALGALLVAALLLLTLGG